MHTAESGSRATQLWLQWLRRHRQSPSAKNEQRVLLPPAKHVAVCEYRGRPTAPPPNGSPLRSWFLCEHPDQPLGPIVCPCNGCGPNCPGYKPEEDANDDGQQVSLRVEMEAINRSRRERRVALPMFRERYVWVSTQQLVQDAIALASALPHDLAGVIGIPRSGILPASVIATHLHLPLFTIRNGEIVELPAGSRGRTVVPRGHWWVVCDDSVYGGLAMQRVMALAALRNRPMLRAAVYVRPEAAHQVDVIGRILPSPHLFEWNLANNGPMAGLAVDPVFGSGVAFDLDGIIVHDSESGGVVGQPYLVPRAQVVPLIVTGRSQSHLLPTRRQITQLGVRYRRLVMRPAEVPDDQVEIARWKGAVYRDSRCGFFLESSQEQAKIIHQVSGKPVICPRAGRVYYCE